MFKFSYKFKTLEKAISFEIKSEIKESIDDFNDGFFGIFGDTETRKIEALQQNKKGLAKKVTEYLNNFQVNLPPEYNQIIGFFKNLEEDEHFIFLPNIPLSQEEDFKLYNVLKSKTTGEDAEILNKDYEDLFKTLLTFYDLKSYGGQRVSIGEKIKSDRICRFCGKSSDEVKFKKTAHAISEALGNKKVFLYEECDSCNDKFSIEIEPDLISFLTFFRSFYDIKGKGGSKKIKGKNFQLENDDIFSIKVQETPTGAENEFPGNVELDFYDKINKQDVYRCLCKYFLSVLDNTQLEYFQETIEWVNKNKSVNDLPKVGQLISRHHFTKEPKIFTYIRKNENYDLPFAIGEFHFTGVILVFIVPLSNRDKKEFLQEEEYEKFWEVFKHYNKCSEWKFHNFSNNTEKKLRLNINFEMEKLK